MSVYSNPAASQLNMEKLCLNHFSQLSAVSLTPEINLDFRISPRILVKIRKGPNWMLRGPEKTDSEKT
jgi:hypothetical protein